MLMATCTLSLASAIYGQNTALNEIASGQLSLMRFLRRCDFNQAGYPSMAVSKWQLRTMQTIGCAPASLGCSRDLRDGPF